MILMNDFKAEAKEMRQAMLGAVGRVFDSGWYIMGEELLAFEKQWAKDCGVQYGVGVANGMDAIEIALRSLKISKGDEVITTSMTAFPTVLAIFRAGAVPILADIDPQTGLLCIDSVKRVISKNTKAILLVHLYGQVREMDLWSRLCQAEGLYLIEDCAQAHSASLGGQKVGSFGEAGAFSFYPTKNLGCIGDGGILVTDNEGIYKESKCLRNYGQSVRYHHPELGLNSRLDEIQAAILLERRKWLKEFTERRQQIAARYRNEINANSLIQLAEPLEEHSHVYHLFVLLCKNRELLIDHLNKNEIQTHVHYPVPIHHQEPCRSLRHDPKGLVEAENHANMCISIPCHPQMTDDDVTRVVSTLNNFDL